MDAKHTRKAFSRDGHPVTIIRSHFEEGVEFAVIRYDDGHLPYDVGGRVAGTEEEPLWEHRVEDGKVLKSGGDYYNEADWVVEKGLTFPSDREGAVLEAGGDAATAVRATRALKRKKLADLTVDELKARMEATTPGLQTWKNARAQMRRVTGMDNEDVGHFMTSGLTWAEYEAEMAARSDEPAPLTHERRDELITEALGIAPGETLVIELDNDAATAAEGGTIMESTAPAAEALMDGIGEAVPNAGETYFRLRAGGKTLGYADVRKDGFRLDVAADAVAKAPAKLAKALEVKGDRRVLRVTAKNEKAARSLVEWLAKQV